MTAPTHYSVLIRDGIEEDIPECVRLDHHFKTDFVWQMNVERDESSFSQVTFRKERLPRRMESQHPADPNRLHLTLERRDCFLVISLRDTNQIIGYLSMTMDPIYRLGLIRDIVIQNEFRGNKLAVRLLNAARTWGKEHQLVRLTAEIPTKNFPAIEFFQTYSFIFCGFNERHFLNQDIAVLFSLPLR